MAPIDEMLTLYNVQVRYYSKTGNTKKIAEAIASATGVKAETTDHPGAADLSNAGKFAEKIQRDVS